MLNTFRHGIHPEGNKGLSKDVPISAMDAPQTLYVPVAQSIGKPPQLAVEIGDRVKKGGLIAKSAGFVSSNVFSPVSGTVKAFEDRRMCSGLTGKHVVIENDFAEDEELLPVLQNPTPREIIDRVAEAGIVGMGGAAFPTPVKLTIPEGKSVDTLIINAAECEPYITCDYRILIELTEEFLQGAQLLAKALGVSRILIGIEDNKPDAAEKLRKAGGAGVEVVELAAKYPQGGEKQLIYSLTRRRVPQGGLPADVRVVVQNVHTALSVYRAAALGKPLYERILTVSGRGIARPSNLWVRTGTLLSQLTGACGGEVGEVKKVLSGGPMTGVAQLNLDSSITKATSAVLFLTKEEIDTKPGMSCINCGRCAKACPMFLMPMYIDGYTLVGEYGLAKKYGAMSCIECGCCSYVCPAKRPLVQSIRLAKKLIKERNI